MTLLRLALRSHLFGLTATCLIAVLFGLTNTVGYAQIAGPDPQSRAVFARQMELIGRQLTYLLPAPLQLETLAGYLHWRVFGTLPLIYGFWGVLAASGLRGDEERGLVEQWLASGVPRPRYVASRTVAFALACAASIAVLVLSLVAGAAVSSEPLDAVATGAQGVALLAVTLTCFAFALVVAQLTTTRRSAAGWAGIIVLALYLVNSSARSGGLAQIQELSPFWHYDRQTPLLRGGALDIGSLATLLATAVVLTGIALAAFTLRDMGASLVRIAPRSGTRSYRASRDPLLRVPVLATLDQQRLWIAGWAIGLAALAAFLISLTRLMVDALVAVPQLRVYFERLGSTGYDTFVAVIWGSTALLFLSVYTVVQVNGWVADDAEGRLEAVLAQPVSRARVVLERIGSLLGGAVGIVLVASLTAYVTASRSGIAVAADRFAVGSALLVTVPFALAAIGATLASWRPRVAVPLLGVVAVVSYF
ncbi:MAG: ABC transporter permease subunit, partial [Chloroflexi bacterium]|nr:ABC transporter permease subunit [Chloroflexota bacterium]